MKVILLNLALFLCLELSIYLGREKIDSIFYGDIPINDQIEDFTKLTKPSRNPKRYFELKQNHSVQFRGKPFSTNELGFRGLQGISKKGPNTKRIIGIGDSVMMGWGVADNETYLSLLEDKLNQQEFPRMLEKKMNQQESLRFESMNLGVAGYNCSQEYETLVTLGQQLEPDLVIIQYVGNDFEPIKSDFKESPYGSRSYLLSLFSFLFYRLTNSRAAITSWEPYQDPSTANTEYFFDCLNAFGEYAKSNNLPVIYVLDSRYVSPIAPHSKIEQEAKKLGFTTLNLFSILRKLPETADLGVTTKVQDLHNQKYIFKRTDDNHPNESWHEVVSSLLYDLVRKSL